MVCDRCKMVVNNELVKMRFHPQSVELGEVEIKGQINDNDKQIIAISLQKLGFELIDDKKSRVIEKVKTEIIQLIHHSSNSIKTNISAHLSEKLKLDYNYLSSLFSEVEGKTIEQFYINQKIEKVKELLVYDELSLSEIAYQLEYSSVAYLSNQFKKVTGFTPSHFKSIREQKRKSLDKL